MAGKTPWYVKHSPEFGGAFNDFHRASDEKSVLDEKTRELLKVALACAFRCPHCTRNHIVKAQKAGATKQEVSEALLMAAVEGAGTQLYWVREVYEEELGD